METATGEDVEHLDVLIIGAGISGIGCAYYLQREHPGKSFALLEARGATGGTWDLFRYPGIRSDSDLFTFGYEFRPWESDVALADGPEILRYVRETAAEYGVDQKVRLHHRVISADWSTEQARWNVEVERTDSGERVRLSAGWIFAGTGYYHYDQGYTPPLPGVERYGGQLIHPQQWPENLDYAGKQVLVIGSGATAVTLIPALAAAAGHVTMLQRSPSYILSIPLRDPVARLLSRLFGPRRGFALNRRVSIFRQNAIYKLCQRYPKQSRAVLRRLTAHALPDGFAVDEHFNPKYDPWDQRLCIVPDGDLFKAISNGSASVVTDTIETFTERGVQLASGRELEADIIITATGLRLLVFGGISVSVDGEPVKLPERLAFKGMMLSGVPNLAYLVGYTNVSWTLKIGPVCEHFCRLLALMDERGYRQCTPELPYPHMTTRPLLNFGAGYVQRSLDELPRQGMFDPWYLAMDPTVDSRNLRHGPVEDRHLRFEVAA
ncbi:MAG TPA: NAD(P)/FAD-dependent oxidoreductase [Solirubrobacteraceae bacterium]|nr:NAD(P)/FAD-dependent oxidoreductase [Solirubrobacteraceae bacterium]